MSYAVSTIAGIIHATALQRGRDTAIENLLTDSRKLLFPGGTLFFALPGTSRSGASFIPGLFKKGVCNFIVGADFEGNLLSSLPDANILQVPDVGLALLQLAEYHRHRFSYPVIGITGSNGKTIVKEWLAQLLSEDYNIVKSPNSYNSQVGVPLSVWRMDESNTLAIFESGISMRGEMESLQPVIDPAIGIFTFLGTAHDEGFRSRAEKISEKLRLFKNSKLLIVHADDNDLQSALRDFTANENPSLELFTRAATGPANLFTHVPVLRSNGVSVSCIFRNETFELIIPFTDAASVDNALTCCATLLALHVPAHIIAARMLHLRQPAMRLELKEGINNCSVINDSYSTDLSSLSISLDFLAQQKQHEKKTVILSDMLQSGLRGGDLYPQVAAALAGKNIERFIGIGAEISASAEAFTGFTQREFFASTEEFLQALPAMHFFDETVLLKGARVFRFEKISHALERKQHETFMEINLNALRHNLKTYRKFLHPGTKVMAMVKAFSYGSGTFEIANTLQHSGVDYLSVAYADEGVSLREAGIGMPIMVMNTEVAGFAQIVDYSLEPEIYSFNILHAFRQYLEHRRISGYPVHIKIDSGMHRLGFEEGDVSALCDALREQPSFSVRSVFSHLAASDAAEHDDFTMRQSEMFLRAAQYIEDALGYKVMRHLSNSSGVFRHPHLQMDMVRLGIGLYGVDASAEVQRQLQPVATLITTISQTREIAAGETVGYNRAGIAKQRTVIATVRIGYADGYPRSLGNGKGFMVINGNPAPVIGNVCMDMTMLDITGIDASEADEVIVFGEAPTVTEMATRAGTISYEILTNISQRVKRIYFEE